MVNCRRHFEVIRDRGFKINNVNNVSMFELEL